MNIKDIVFVDGDDWQGVYIDGKLISEGHKVNWLYVINQLGYYTTAREADYEWLEDRSNFPEDLSNVKFYE